MIGKADMATLLQMNKPRCGGKDLGEQRVEPNYMTLKEKLKSKIKDIGHKLGHVVHAMPFHHRTNTTHKDTNASHAKTRDKRHTLAGLAIIFFFTLIILF